MKEWLSDLLCRFISVKSLSGQEENAISFLAAEFERLGWTYELLPFEGGRSNILMCSGSPRTIFTTHVDVVPAPESLFTPVRQGGSIYGRGANDAKGIAIAMLGAAKILKDQNKKDFALLFVLEEETTGAGARSAATALKGRGVINLVNGEPTENRLAVAHKGVYGAWISTLGKSCHSGYPQFGKDAIEPLIRIAADLYDADFGYDSELGAATITIGKIEGGTASNVVPDRAGCSVLIRTVTDNSKVREKVLQVVNGRGDVEERHSAELVRMNELPGFETTVVSYGTDIPHFDALGARAFLYGPGTIERAHTDHEFIKESELMEAVEGYVKIYETLIEQG